MIMGKRKGKGDGSEHGNNNPWPGKSRRRRLLQLGAFGALGPAGLCGLIQAALANGDAPPLAGVNSLSGSATINGVVAKVGSAVKPGDEIATARGGSAVVVIGRDAFLLRENTRVIFEPKRDEPGVLGAIVISAGKLLSVFGKRSNSTLTLRAQAATIGIRGTGCYLEIEPGRTYFCLCYGEATISGGGMAASRMIKTVHHDNPVWLDERGTSMTVEKGPFLNHRDEELILLEKLTGREPPFVKMGLSGRY
jgi:hypothetical protein